MISFSVHVQVDNNQLEKEINKRLKKAQFILDNQILKDSNYYIPVDMHTLEDSGLLASKLGKGKIVWNTPYARRLYYHPEYHFSKDKNTNAQGLWFEAAKANHGSEWAQVAQTAYDRG